MATRDGSGPIKRVPADEFARHAAEYLEGSETVSVEKDGEVIGRYVPAPNGHGPNGGSYDGPASDDALLRELEKKLDSESLAIIGRLQATLQQIYAETGLTEDEFADLLDPSKPFPHDPNALPEGVIPIPQAGVIFGDAPLLVGSPNYGTASGAWYTWLS